MVIRQAAFSKKLPFLKGQLHCHTTLSDGTGSPEGTVRQYANAGFDFLAITDHHRYNTVNYAPDTGILILPGMEADRFLDGPGMPVVHVVSVGPAQGSGFAEGQMVEFARGGCAADCQDIIDTVRQAGNLPILAHPTWSGNTAEDVKALRDYSLIEIWNTASVVNWGVEDRGYHWDVLLHEGRRVYGVASDDSHALQECGLGFVRVAAEKNTDAILQALQNGEFYASCGPEIYDFYVEDGYACISCSPVSRITAYNFSAPHHQLRGQNMTGGQIKLRDCCRDYIRMEVVDDRGRSAWTNPIFLSE